MNLEQNIASKKLPITPAAFNGNTNIKMGHSHCVKNVRI